MDGAKRGRVSFRNHAESLTIVTQGEQGNAVADEQSATEPPKGEPTISRAALSRFMDTRNVDRKCPCCGENRWEVLTEDAVEGVAMLRLGGDALVYPDAVLPALVLVCDNCAYLWMVARKRVAQWLKDNPDPAT